MKKLIISRVVVDIILVLCVIFGWWYAALPLGLIASWFFPYYAEFILAGLFYDALFGLGEPTAGVWAYFGTIISVIASFSIYFVKRSIRRS
jgi:hypothetical protein